MGYGNMNPKIKMLMRELSPIKNIYEKSSNIKDMIVTLDICSDELDEIVKDFTPSEDDLKVHEMLKEASKHIVKAKSLLESIAYKED